MFVRTSITAALGLAVAGVALSAAPALALDYTPDANDSLAAPVAADLVAVGSDTTMISIYQAAKVWNADLTKAAKVASFAGLPTGDTLPLPSGSTALVRPKDSGAGIKAVRENTAVDFARASRFPKTDGSENDVTAVPFAMDHVGVAVKAAGPLAGLSLTNVQLYKIFTGAVTDWNQISPALGSHPIKVLGPASGGTHDFFLSKIQGYAVADGAAKPTDYVRTTAVQEHDATPIAADDYAIAPFSIGRAGLANAAAIKVLGGMDEKRAVYNVVRSTDAARADLNEFFDFLCSPSATKAIKDGGLTQLADANHGGVCGEPAAADVTNLTTTDALAAPATVTIETLTAVADGPNAVLKAKLTPATAAGTVSFFEGSKLLKAKVALTSGTATYAVTGAGAGSHTYTAVFVPNDAWAHTAVQKTAAPVTVVGGISSACSAATAALTKALGVQNVAGGAKSAATTALSKAKSAAAVAGAKVASAKKAVTKASKSVKKATKAAAKKKAKKKLTVAKKSLTSAKSAQAKASTQVAGAAASVASTTAALTKAQQATVAATTAKAAACA